MASTFSNEHGFRQDMPPPGGYANIYYQRTFPKIVRHAGKLFFGLLAVTGVGYYRYIADKSTVRKLAVEQQDVRNVVTVFLDAERDRMWLKLMKKTREREEAVMKDVPGWQVGTFYGEPIYYTIPPDQWWDPRRDHYIHMPLQHNKYLFAWRMDADLIGAPKWYDKYIPDFIDKL